MPRERCPQERFEAEKDRICEQGLVLICEQGFENFSMRKLAFQLGIAAKTIYNYFTNKDELYLRILSRGFEELTGVYEEIYRRHDTPLERLREMNRAYVRFGITNPNHYNLMFNWDVPKFIDYIGTQEEPTAHRGRLTARAMVDITIRVVREFAESTSAFPAHSAPYRTLQHWSAIHGIVTMYNSRIIEVVVRDDPEKALWRLVDDLMLPFTPAGTDASPPQKG